MNKKKIGIITGIVLLISLCVYLYFNPAWITHPQYMLDKQYCEQDSDCESDYECGSINIYYKPIISNYNTNKNVILCTPRISNFTCIKNQCISNQEVIN